tara:strand:+ start:1765 stop:1932 length:168 start_codon:yes stop_codon:yes gene_type:complete
VPAAFIEALKRSETGRPGTELGALKEDTAAALARKHMTRTGILGEAVTNGAPLRK